MQRLQFVTYRDQTNGIIYLHENKRNERLMQKKTPITDPLYRSVQCLRPFLIARPKDSHQRLPFRWSWPSCWKSCTMRKGWRHWRDLHRGSVIGVSFCINLSFLLFSWRKIILWSLYVTNCKLCNIGLKDYLHTVPITLLVIGITVIHFRMPGFSFSVSSGTAQWGVAWSAL